VTALHPSSNTNGNTILAQTSSAILRDVQRWVGFGLILVSAAAFGAMPIFARFVYAAGVDTFTLLARHDARATTMLAALHTEARLAGAELMRVVAPGAAPAAIAASGWHDPCQGLGVGKF
jgi:hypothetical protein